MFMPKTEDKNSGKEAMIIRELDPDEIMFDTIIGKMYQIQFLDGSKSHAYEDELLEIRSTKEEWKEGPPAEEGIFLLQGEDDGGYPSVVVVRIVHQPPKEPPAHDRSLTFQENRAALKAWKEEVGDRTSWSLHIVEGIDTAYRGDVKQMRRLVKHKRIDMSF